jgi:hypothetical protein
MTTPSESKHTPGPWRWKTEGIDELESLAGPSNSVCDFGVNIPHDSMPGNSPSNADKALIAAAPDLLAALKGVVRVADRATVEFDAARTAIAKAEGRS